MAGSCSANVWVRRAPSRGILGPSSTGSLVLNPAERPDQSPPSDVPAIGSSGSASRMERDVSPQAPGTESCFEQLVQELIASPDQSLHKIVQFLNQDGRLRGQVIREANAFIYSMGRPVASLVHAVACLGFKRCMAIITANQPVGESHEATRVPAPRSSTRSEQGESLLRGPRSYRKQRSSSLYPPKNPRNAPHFTSSLFERT